MLLSFLFLFLFWHEGYREKVLTKKIQEELSVFTPVDTRYLSLPSRGHLCDAATLTSLNFFSDDFLPFISKLNLDHYFFIFEGERLFVFQDNERIQIFPEYKYDSNEDFNILDSNKTLFIDAIKQWRLSLDNSVSAFVISDGALILRNSPTCNWLDNSFLKSAFD